MNESRMEFQFLDRIRRRLLRIDDKQVLFDTRGFVPTKLQGHLEAIGRSFLLGYHMALDDSSLPRQCNPFSTVASCYRGFAFEGASMAMALCDALGVLRRNRWSEFVKGGGASHIYVLHVGLGWAVARVPWYRRSPEKVMKELDPLLRWLVIDGLGFHEGFFNWKARSPSEIGALNLSPYGMRVFDQGLGRSLWFGSGAEVAGVARIIESFAPSRRADLWSGVGLAACYAGDLDSAEIECLIDASQAYGEHLAQGIVFGAEARELGGIPTSHTERICNCVCGLTSAEAAEISYAALPAANDSHQPAYETWRANIRETLRSRISA
ncbi:MAG: DUF1702 family protein [Pirellulaceae bacterium]|nr:DUF1702 family protein [Pirellulaceae bacterium]